MTTPKQTSLSLEQQIVFIRNERVMLDETLAVLYCVETRVLLQAVKRNIDRFPSDFMFKLTKEEFQNLTSQNVISSWGGRRHSPYAFTEQGVAMLSSVLHSKQAVQVNVEIMRTFVRIRQMLDSHRDLKQKIELLEKKYDKNFKIVFEAIHRLRLPQSLAISDLLGLSLPLRLRKNPNKILISN